MKADKAGTSPLVMVIVEDLLDQDDPKGYIEDVTNHGCVSGTCAELIYYKDTCAFYGKHKEEIWEMAGECQQAGGYKTVLEFLATLNGAENADTVDQFENLMAWFAYEETTRKVAGMLDIEI